MVERSDFKIIPGADELAGLERDLRFHPVTNAAPRRLSPQDIAAFNRDGHIGPFRILEPDEVDDLRAYFDELLARELAAGRDSYAISSAHLRHGRVWDLLRDPRIVSIVTDLLGDDVIGWGSHFFCKMPGDGKRVDWHQDASYWPLSPSKAVTIWLAIDDADVENACMRFISGSHHYGHLTYRRSAPDERNVLDQAVEHPERYGLVFDDVLRAGEASAHSDLLLHGSEPNESSRRRCGLTLRYCSADVRAGLDWNEKGVRVSGSDPSGHWGDRPRPENE